MAGVLLPIGIGVVKSGLSGFDEDPQSIMADAMDPNVDPIEVLTRARLRSKSGKLLQAAQEAIAKRGTI